MDTHGGAEILAPIYLSGIGYYGWRIKEGDKLPENSLLSNVSHAWMLTHMFYNDVVQPNTDLPDLNIAFMASVTPFVAVGAMRLGLMKAGMKFNTTPIAEAIHVGMHLNNAIHTAMGHGIHHFGSNPGWRDDFNMALTRLRTDVAVTTGIDVAGLAFNTYAGAIVLPKYIYQDLKNPDVKIRVAELFDDFYHGLMYARMGAMHATSLLSLVN